MNPYQQQAAMNVWPLSQGLGSNVDPVGTLRFEAGRLLCKSIRNYVKEMQFLGHDITMHEGEGFLSRPFVIRGKYSVLKPIENWIDLITKEGV